MESFWHTLKKPFMELAPMADVTDPAYRALIANTGKPDVTWTEFVSADGLFHTREKKRMKDDENPLMRDLQYTKGERPIVAQFFTGSPDMMKYAAELAVALKFDGFAINMGCPDTSIEKQGAGAAHMKDPMRAVDVITAALEGTGGKIPVTVKTRLGYNKIEYKEWLPYLLHSGIHTLTLHMRTRKEMSLVPAHYELAEEIVAFCKKENPAVLISGNGDLTSTHEAREKAIQYGFDGMMLGRAIFGNPWLFKGESPTDHTPEERMHMLLTLTEGFDQLTPQKHFAILKKHVKAFVNGWDGASELRARLMEARTKEEFIQLLRT